MIVKKFNELGFCQECGKRQSEKLNVYEMDFGTTNIVATYLCRNCIERLWINIGIILDAEEREEHE